MKAKKIYLDDGLLVFLFNYAFFICVVLAVLLWCRPHWWDNVGIHYYSKPFCECTQCKIVKISEENFRSGGMSWRFKGL